VRRLGLGGCLLAQSRTAHHITISSKCYFVTFRVGFMVASGAEPNGLTVRLVQSRAAVSQAFGGDFRV
jgi:hypothetical protein